MTVRYFAKLGMIEELNIPFIKLIDETTESIDAKKEASDQYENVKTQCPIVARELLNACSNYLAVIELTKEGE